MVGNDIVDLSLAKVQSNWERKGFLEKQFTPSEIERILKSTNPFFLVWLFWSMKEAAYKCFVQKEKVRFFNPKRLECSTTDFRSGRVQIDDTTLYTSSSFNSSYIHTIAINSKNNKVKSKKITITDSKKESKILKEAIVKNFPEKATLTKDTLGIPSLYCSRQQKLIPVSISHHGSYGAYAILEK